MRRPFDAGARKALPRDRIGVFIFFQEGKAGLCLCHTPWRSAVSIRGLDRDRAASPLQQSFPAEFDIVTLVMIAAFGGLDLQ